MNKEETLENFLRIFKAALTNSFLYSPNHPYFLTSVENLRKNIEAALQFTHPLVIAVTNTTVQMEGLALHHKVIHEELARILYQRKIKTIKIKEGVNEQELIAFLRRVSLSAKEILKQGGMKALFEGVALAHIEFEEIDYSLFLSDSGGELKDIWSYMLKDALEKKRQRCD